MLYAMPTPRRLSRDGVLEAALRVVDAEGLEGLTMRRLGAELGVEAMSLYRHLPGKDAVLDGMIERILAEVELPGAAAAVEPRDAIMAMARSYRRAALRHPRAFPLVVMRPVTGPVGLRVLEAVLQQVMAAGLRGAAAVERYRALTSYVTGFALLDIGRATAAAARPAPDLTDFPGLAGLVPAMQTADPERAFESGLALLLEDLR
jgi:AcrR family transcriptional regulator